MESIDPRKTQRVWQRVAIPSQPPQNLEGLRELTLEAMKTAALDRVLVNSLSGQHKDAARKLLEQQQETAACLRGMLILTGSKIGSPKLPEVSMPIVQRLLSLCYSRARDAQREYTARTIDPEFGSVFQILAQREQLRCTAITRLLGILS